MIAYDLRCGNGHQFEGWFEDSRAFDLQKKQGLIACPICEDADICKIPSTFAIKGTPGAISLSPDKHKELAALGRQIADYVENHFDNVGADFAQEALKMHYGVAEPRNIRGVSTPKEEETLKAEGISFFKLPVPAKSTDPESS
ncbi:MAG TPA: DUF1178 family protein [Desulfosarcina sp.]|nr:DUF1178 family protein [Desulfosarcina sp.]